MCDIAAVDPPLHLLVRKPANTSKQCLIPRLGSGQELQPYASGCPIHTRQLVKLLKLLKFLLELTCQVAKPLTAVLIHSTQPEAPMILGMDDEG
jgi:hypothetical protein